MRKKITITKGIVNNAINNAIVNNEETYLEVMRKKLERMDVAQKLAFRFKMAGVKELSTRNFVHWHKRLDYHDCNSAELSMYVKPSKEFINKVINFFYGR